MENYDCIICNSSKNKLYKEFSDNKFRLVQCECSFIYLNPRPDKMEIKQYYLEDYIPHKKYITFIENIFQKLSFYWKYKNIKKVLYIKGKHLDVGSGNSNFSTFLNSKGWNSLSYDRYAKSDINNLNEISNSSLDLITMWHSIEHIHEINDILPVLISKLKDDGYLMIACPNVEAYEKKYFDEMWIAYDIPRHLYHFNATTLEKYVNRFNFNVENKVSMYQDTFFNIYLSSTSSFKKKLLIIPYLAISLIKIYLNDGISSSYLYICRKKI